MRDSLFAALLVTSSGCGLHLGPRVAVVSQQTSGVTEHRGGGEFGIQGDVLMLHHDLDVRAKVQFAIGSSSGEVTGTSDVDLQLGYGFFPTLAPHRLALRVGARAFFTDDGASSLRFLELPSLTLGYRYATDVSQFDVHVRGGLLVAGAYRHGDTDSFGLSPSLGMQSILVLQRVQFSLGYSRYFADSLQHLFEASGCASLTSKLLTGSVLSGSRSAAPLSLCAQARIVRGDFHGDSLSHYFGLQLGVGFIGAP